MTTDDAYVAGMMRRAEDVLGCSGTVNKQMARRNVRYIRYMLKYIDFQFKYLIHSASENTSCIECATSVPEYSVRRIDQPAGHAQISDVAVIIPVV